MTSPKSQRLRFLECAGYSTSMRSQVLQGCCSRIEIDGGGTKDEHVVVAIGRGWKLYRKQAFCPAHFPQTGGGREVVTKSAGGSSEPGGEG